jgi:hypothetical protein
MLGYVCRLRVERRDDCALSLQGLATLRGDCAMVNSRSNDRGVSQRDGMSLTICRRSPQRMFARGDQKARGREKTGSTG